jgi:hypothetical protein
LAAGPQAEHQVDQGQKGRPARQGQQEQPDRLDLQWWLLQMIRKNRFLFPDLKGHKVKQEQVGRGIQERQRLTLAHSPERLMLL